MATSDSTVTGAAGRYATALFDLAQDENVLDAIASDLDDLALLMNESQDLHQLVSSPLYSRDDQARAMAALLEKAGAHALTMKFIGLVASKRRLFVLGDIIKAYKVLLSRHRGEVSAEVVSAIPLGDAQVAALKSSLKQAVGKDVQLEATVDESLLGGLVIKLGSRMVDSSLRTKLNNLKIAMKEVG